MAKLSEVFGGAAAIAKGMGITFKEMMSPTVTENYPMSKINDAFEHLESGKARYRIVLEANF